jgi:hypothetical protein
MNTSEIYNLAKTMSLDFFNVNLKSLKTNDLKSFNSLVKLGDSKELALATVLGEDKNTNYSFYKNAYEN